MLGWMLFLGFKMSELVLVVNNIEVVHPDLVAQAQGVVLDKNRIRLRGWDPGPGQLVGQTAEIRQAGRRLILMTIMRTGVS